MTREFARIIMQGGDFLVHPRNSMTVGLHVETNFGSLASGRAGCKATCCQLRGDDERRLRHCKRFGQRRLDNVLHLLPLCARNVHGELAVEDRERRARRIEAAELLVLAAPALLRQRPAARPVAARAARDPLLAVVRLGAALVLVLAAPAPLPQAPRGDVALVAVVARLPAFRAAFPLVQAAPVPLVPRPMLALCVLGPRGVRIRLALVTVEGSSGRGGALLALDKTTPLTLLDTPIAQLVACMRHDTIERRLGRSRGSRCACGLAATVLILATPILLHVGPAYLPMRISTTTCAIKRLAGRVGASTVMIGATPILFVLRPSILPSGPTDCAIKGIGYDRWIAPDLVMRAAVLLFLKRPLSHDGDTNATIKCQLLFSLTFPIVGAVTLWGLLNTTAVVIATTPFALVLRPTILPAVVPRCAVVRIRSLGGLASDLLVLTTPALLVVRPLWHQCPTNFAIERPVAQRPFRPRQVSMRGWCIDLYLRIWRSSEETFPKLRFVRSSTSTSVSGVPGAGGACGRTDRIRGSERGRGRGGAVP
mmetsp:Transcript_89596/g.253573  ORF Transcript_89596/g.253573 Transcript_89596/m.253573 type:complete len:538 (-) Transcript_89596:1238-2851(-)